MNQDFYKLEMDSEMDGNTVISIIKKKFSENGGSARIPLQRGGHFRAKLVDGGIEVDNLGKQSFLPWRVFQEAINLLMHKHGIAVRGNAMNSRLGTGELPFDSIEGHIAAVVYNKKEGDSVFRRITPIACILKWAGICRFEPGKLVLL